LYKTIYPVSDHTIYERFPDQNTSVDQILELWPVKQGQPNETEDYWVSTINSRILIKFNLTEISSSINGREFQAYLRLHATEATNSPTSYTLYSYPLSGSIVNGTGFFNSNPEITSGVSWNYKSSKLIGERWATTNYNSNTTGSLTGGGNWYTNVSGSQAFENDSPDVRMDVTNIVKTWLSGSISNDGFIVKYKDSDETSLQTFGHLKFFSLETHTIYIPRLEVYWDDSVVSGTGSFDEVESDDQVLYIKNLKDIYSENEKPILRLGSRTRYPIQTYSTSSNYLIQKRLPVNTYYQIRDSVTSETVIPFSVIGTKVSCDMNGNFIKLDCSSMLPEREYHLIFKCEFADGAVNYIDQNYNFTITRH
jgi:hypothetical protein